MNNTRDVKLPVHFYNVIKDWSRIENWPDYFVGLNSIAINNYNDSLAKLSEQQLKSENNRNIKLLNEWKQKGWIDPRARKVPSIVER